MTLQTRSHVSFLPSLKPAKTMLQRIYADNFRCLSNFELDLDEANIFLGANGTGKTSVLHILRCIQISTR